MSPGSLAFSARANAALSIEWVNRALATCPSACTPASVRPAPCTVTALPSISPNAASRSAWIVGAPF